MMRDKILAIEAQASLQGIVSGDLQSQTALRDLQWLTSASFAQVGLVHSRITHLLKPINSWHHRVNLKASIFTLPSDGCREPLVCGGQGVRTKLEYVWLVHSSDFSPEWPAMLKIIIHCLPGVTAGCFENRPSIAADLYSWAAHNTHIDMQCDIHWSCVLANLNFPLGLFGMLAKGVQDARVVAGILNNHDIQFVFVHSNGALLAKHCMRCCVVANWL
mmetsp:Transcript_57039/g.104334  ORF Transcript_57039/g.104334 Transcript_57039/m.104334 type:complete len:218 (+) Transcript_57039:1053-1706(+)